MDVLFYLLNISLLIFVVRCQQCNRYNNSTECIRFESSEYTSLKQALHQLRSKIVVLDILTAGNGSDHTSGVTVLSSLIDIGVIPAYGHATKKDPAMYLQWMQIYRAIDNPLVFFTEKHSVAKEMISIRQGKPTIVVVIVKESTWAFGYLGPRYSNIFDDENYPKHHPNTVYSDYASVTHLKFELMQILTIWNYFNTESAAWLDIGAYKNAVDDEDFRSFTIRNLPGYDQTKVTLNYIRDPKPRERNHRYIMKYSPSIFAGGFWIGHINPLKQFVSEYRKHVEILLGEGLANCEEQVMASMFVDGTQFQPHAEVQPFRALNYEGCDRWLCLAHRTRELGLS